jgi:hypothetical protein
LVYRGLELGQGPEPGASAEEGRIGRFAQVYPSRNGGEIGGPGIR